MVTVELEFTQGLFRIFENGCRENRDPFDAVISVMLMAGKKAWLYGAKGDISPEAYGLVARKLRDELGVETVEMERHGRIISLTKEKVERFLKLGL